MPSPASPSLDSFPWPPRSRLIIGHPVRLPSSLLSVLVLHLVTRLLPPRGGLTWTREHEFKDEHCKAFTAQSWSLFSVQTGTNKETKNSLQSATESKNLLLFLWEDVCNHTDCSRFYTFTFSDFLNTRFKKGFLWALMAVTIQSWFVKTNSSLTNLHIFKFNFISSGRLKPFGLFPADFNNKRISGVSADVCVRRRLYSVVCLSHFSQEDLLIV